MTHLPTRSERGPTSSKWFLMHPGVMVFFCTPLSKESHTALPINPYPGYILHPIPSLKGIGIQEGSLCMTFCALGVPSWGAFSMVTFS